LHNSAFRQLQALRERIPGSRIRNPHPGPNHKEMNEREREAMAVPRMGRREGDAEAGAPTRTPEDREREERTYRLVVGGDYDIGQYGQQRWSSGAGQASATSSSGARGSEGIRSRGEKHGRRVAGPHGLLQASAAYMQRNLIDSSDGESEEEEDDDAMQSVVAFRNAGASEGANMHWRLPSVADDGPGTRAMRPPYVDAPPPSVIRLPEAGLDDSPEPAVGVRSFNCSLNPIRRDTQSVSATPQGLGKKSLTPRARSREPPASGSAQGSSTPAPTTSRGKPERLLHKAGASVTPASIDLVLSMQLSEVQDVEVFKREVAADVAVALGTNATDVRVAGLRAGTVVAEVQATPLGGLTASQLKQMVVEQCKDGSSLLRRGKHTAKCRAVIDPETGELIAHLGTMQSGAASPNSLSLSIISHDTDIGGQTAHQEEEPGALQQERARAHAASARIAADPSTLPGAPGPSISRQVLAQEQEQEQEQEQRAAAGRAGQRHDLAPREQVSRLVAVLDGGARPAACAHATAATLILHASRTRPRRRRRGRALAAARGRHQAPTKRRPSPWHRAPSARRRASRRLEVPCLPRALPTPLGWRTWAPVLAKCCMRSLRVRAGWNVCAAYAGGVQQRAEVLPADGSMPGGFAWRRRRRRRRRRVCSALLVP